MVLFFVKTSNFRQRPIGSSIPFSPRRKDGKASDNAVARRPRAAITPTFLESWLDSTIDVLRKPAYPRLARNDGSKASLTHAKSVARCALLAHRTCSRANSHSKRSYFCGRCSSETLAYRLLSDYMNNRGRLVIGAARVCTTAPLDVRVESNRQEREV